MARRPPMAENGDVAGGEADQPNTTVAPNGAVTVVWKTASPLRVVHGQDFFLQTATTRAPAPAP